jgi:hypothetical protein
MIATQVNLSTLSEAEVRRQSLVIAAAEEEGAEEEAEGEGAVVEAIVIETGDSTPQI